MTQTRLNINNVRLWLHTFRLRSTRFPNLKGSVDSLQINPIGKQSKKDLQIYLAPGAVLH